LRRPPQAGCRLAVHEVVPLGARFLELPRAAHRSRFRWSRLSKLIDKPEPPDQRVAAQTPTHFDARSANWWRRYSPLYAVLMGHRDGTSLHGSPPTQHGFGRVLDEEGRHPVPGKTPSCANAIRHGMSVFVDLMGRDLGGARPSRYSPVASSQPDARSKFAR